MTTPEFHRATVEDLDGLMPLLARLRIDDPTLGGAPFDLADTRSALAQLIAADHLGRVWLIDQGNQTIGYIVLTYTYSLEFAGPAAFIDELWIAPEHRGRGIGTRAIGYAESESRRAGIRCLLLEVSPDNTDAQRLYSKLGFGAREFRFMYKRL